MELRDRRVLITGASRGIGEAMAGAFAAAGARVALVARSEPAIAALAARLGGTAHACDLADPRQLAGLIGRIEQAGGPIDVLVNNAGVDASGRLEDLGADALERLFRVNLLAVAELCRQVLPGMLARDSGHIVNMSSLAGVVAFPGFAAYGATKAGLSHFTAGLRGDLQGTGVKTTLVELGPVPTELLANAKSHPPTEAAFARTGRLHLARDVPREEVARHVVKAVKQGRRHVRLPRRGAPLAALAELPRAVFEWVLAGIPRR